MLKENPKINSKEILTLRRKYRFGVTPHRRTSNSNKRTVSNHLSDPDGTKNHKLGRLLEA